MRKAVRNRRDLLQWASRQKLRSLSGEQIAALDSAYPAWRNSRSMASRRIWDDCFSETVALVSNLGRWPLYSGTGDERRAYDWLKLQRGLPVDSARRGRLDDALPGWERGSQDDVWDERLSEVIEFVATRGVLPRRGGKGESKRLARWLLLQRHGTGVTERRRKLLDLKLPGWSDSPDDKWEAALAFIVDYFAEHGTFPVSISGDANEAFHGRWLSTQRFRSEKLSDERRARLDSCLPMWRDARVGRAT